MSTIPKSLSSAEEEFALHCDLYRLRPEREQTFCHRKWRFDFSWPDKKIAAEIEGGIWSGGRHTRGNGFSEDCAKYNQATLLGWRVFRFTPAMVTSCEAIDTIREALT
jgi:hypothetical protein